MNRYTFEGVTDEVSTCDCCGREGLKRVIALSEEGVVSYYGTTCASHLLKIPAKDVTKAAKSAQDEKDAAARRARQAERDAEYAAWTSFLFSATGIDDVALAIQALGGYSAARALQNEKSGK